MSGRLTCLLAMMVACAPLGAVDYSEVQDILTQSCIDCHGPSKAKGGLRLDSSDMVMKGGKHGAAVVPGFPADSPLYTRVTLPADDPDVMPAKGDHLSEHQTATILAWIKAGAAAATAGDAASSPPASPGTPTAPVTPAPGMAAEAPKADPMAASANEPPLHPVVPPATGVASKSADSSKSAAAAAAPTKLVLPDTDLDTLAQGLTAPDTKTIDGLKAISVWDRALSKNGALIELDCRQISPPITAHLHTLSALSEHVVWLNLAGLALTDADLAQLTAFSRLSRLHLERSTVGDSAMTQVGKLTQLTYLNLYGTKITDAGLSNLATLTKLSELFLLGTTATPAGAESLKKSIPGLTVVFDESLPPPAAPGEGKKKGKGKKAQ